jgi:beta-galactosidase
MIFPRVNVGLSREWEDAHPNELNDQGPKTLPHIRRVCFSSDVWAEEVERLLGLFVAHIEASDYCDRIIGYQIAGGNTEEWFSYDQRGGIGPRSREKFAVQVAAGRENSTYEYYRYLSDITAARICRVAARIKALTDRRLVVGTFYGYTLEKCYRYFTHNDLKQVLDCPDIDFICSPVSYAETRTAGRNHSYMLALHSLKLHGKLYFSENDTRTHLSRAYSDLPRYQSPLWFGPDVNTTLEILKMHFARALVHGHASWWFDMWGGWFADPAYMGFMKQAREITLAARDLPAHSRAEVALLFDERAVAGFDDDDPTPQRVLYDIREALGKTGVPYDLYLTTDYDAIADRYKAFVLLEPAPTADSLRIKRKSHPVYVVNAENADVTPAELRRFYRQAGVWLYTDHDAVVYASESHLFLHTVIDGRQSVHLPQNTEWLDLFTGEKFEPCFTSSVGKSYLLQRKK